VFVSHATHVHGRRSTASVFALSSGNNVYLALPYYYMTVPLFFDNLDSTCVVPLIVRMPILEARSKAPQSGLWALTTFEY